MDGKFDSTSLLWTILGEAATTLGAILVAMPWWAVPAFLSLVALRVLHPNWFGAAGRRGRSGRGRRERYRWRRDYDW